MLTETEKYIYNTFLKISNTARGKPFKYRKDFSKFDSTQGYYLNRLSNFFKNHPQVKMKDFFEAPYHVYQDEYFDLKYYTTLKAIGVWKMYIKSLIESDPDSDAMVAWINEGLDAVKVFCEGNFIKISDYCGHIDQTSGINSSVIHLRDLKIPIYLIFALTDSVDYLEKLDETLKKSLTPFGIQSNIKSFEERFSNSRIKNILKTKLN